MKQKYLNRYGYMTKMESNMDMGSPKMRSVIMDFQRFMGIEESGTLDKDTMDMMNMPRCGVADNVWPRTKRNLQNSKRYKRYSLQGSVWPTKNITWKMADYSRRSNLRGRDQDIERLMDYALTVCINLSNSSNIWLTENIDRNGVVIVL